MTPEARIEQMGLVLPAPLQAAPVPRRHRVPLLPQTRPLGLRLGLGEGITLTLVRQLLVRVPLEVPGETGAHQEQAGIEVKRTVPPTVRPRGPHGADDAPVAVPLLVLDPDRAV